jgi:ketosteroid isomerase-like protein
MSSSVDRTEIARSVYRAFAAGEREVVEALFAPDFSFHSPPDPDLDRDGYFERCWPNSGNLCEFEFVRAIESGDEVVLTYEARRVDGTRFRNTEVLTFDAEKIVEVEVYFGWDLD